MTWLVRLYPRGWRDRYEEEFLLLLEARPPSFVDRLDILRGAVDARLHPQVRHPESPAPAPAESAPDDLVVARRLGYATLVGGALWIAAWVVAVTSPVVYDGYGPHHDPSFAIPLFMLGLFLLVAGLIGQLIVLPGELRVARWAAVIAIPFAILWALAPWMFHFLLPLLVCLVLFAVAARRAPTWSGAASGMVVIGCAGFVGFALVTMGLFELGLGLPYEFLAVIGSSATPIWIGVGGTLVRQRTAVARALPAA
jgi:hypothetical protein